MTDELSKLKVRTNTKKQIVKLKDWKLLKCKIRMENCENSGHVFGNGADIRKFNEGAGNVLDSDYISAKVGQGHYF